MYNTFLKHIQKNSLISKNDKVLIAFSGGKDSVVLLDLLSKFNISIAIAHIDHQIRENSYKDALFSKNISQKYNIPYFEEKINLKGLNSNIEAIAREERYNALIKIAKGNNYNKIVTAHTKSDNIENFFIRLYRGTSLDGLGGIKEIKDNIIVRPLLIFTSQEIKDYIINNRLSNIEDDSNKDIRFLRNRVRNEIIPSIELEDYSILKNINNLTQQIKLENDFMNQEVLKIIKNDFFIFDNIIFTKRDKFNQLHLAIKFRVINHILLNFLNISSSKDRITQINNIFNTKNRRETIKNIIISSDYNFIAFEKPKNRVFDFKELDEVFEVIKDDIKFFKDTSYNHLIITPNMKISSFKNGDFFIKYNGKRKKLKDIFIDNKIPRFLRKYWPVLKLNNKIIAVFSIEKGNYYKNL